MGVGWVVEENGCQSFGGERYLVEGVLGQGGYAKVFAATRVRDGALVAIKEVKEGDVSAWDEIDDDLVPLEVGLLHKVRDVEGVLQLYSFCEQGGSYLLILERLQRTMNLYNYLFGQQTHVIDENLGKKYFRQIIRMVLGCFDKGVFHRDIKLENILVDLDNVETVKLIDFGCGAFLNPWDHYEEFKGTAEYSPPEWIAGEPYRAGPLTVWSLGVLLFEMLCKKLPFKDEVATCEAELEFDFQLTAACQNLIKACLEKQPEKRIKLEEMLTHPWLGSGKRKAEEAVNLEEETLDMRGREQFSLGKLVKGPRLSLLGESDGESVAAGSNKQEVGRIEETDGDWALLIDDDNLTSPPSAAKNGDGIEEFENNWEKEEKKEENCWAVDDFPEENALDTEVCGVEMVSPAKPLLTRKLTTPESMMIDDDSDEDGNFAPVVVTSLGDKLGDGGEMEH